MNMSTSTRESEGGRTELTIADGFVYVDIFRGKIHVEQRKYDARDLLTMAIDVTLLSGVSYSTPSLRRPENR